MAERIPSRFWKRTPQLAADASKAEGNRLMDYSSKDGHTPVAVLINANNRLTTFCAGPDSCLGVIALLKTFTACFGQTSECRYREKR